MFAYCNNKPVSKSDATGYFAISISTCILVGSAIAGAGFAGYTAYKEHQAGLSTIRIIGDSICAGFSVFFIAYTGGMSLYQCYQNYCYLNSITPVTQIGSQPTVANQLQACADTANAGVQGSGPVVGTKKHTLFSSEVNALGNSNLRTEVSYLNGQEVPYGTKNSIRFDVLQYNNGVPCAAWDFKTGSAVLTSARISQMQARSGLNIPINMVK